MEDTLSGDGNDDGGSLKHYLQRSYPSEYKRDRTNAFITISIELSST